MAYQTYRLGGGLNLKGDATDIADDQLQQATGCRFDVKGAVSSDRGRELLRAIRGGVRGMADATLNGTKWLLSKGGSTLFKNSVTQGAFGTGSGDITVVPYNDYAYIADGATFKRFKVTATVDTLEAVGLAAPTVALTTGVSGSGNTIATGTYKYVYTYYNGVAESNFSPSASQAVTLGEQVDLTVISAGPAGTTARRIYRTDMDGTAYFFLGEISDNTTTTYTDTKKLPDEADASATPGDDVTVNPRNVATIPEDQAIFPSTSTQQTNFGVRRGNEVRATNLGILADWTDHDVPPATIRDLVFIREQIFGIVGNSIRFSKTGQPEHWPIYNEIPIGRQTGETLQTIRPLGDAIIAYTDASVYRVETIGLSFEDSRTVQTDSPVGLAARRAVSEITLNGQKAHVFLAKNGIYLFDGQNAVEVSRNIERLFEPESTHEDRFYPSAISVACMTSHRDKLWLSYPAPTSSVNNRTLLADFQDPRDIKISIMPYGFACMALDSIDNIPLGGTSAGHIYKLDTGNSNHGADLLWEPTTKDFTFGDPTTFKRFQEILIDADLGGASTTVTVTTNRGATTSFTLDSANGREKFIRALPGTMKGEFVRVGLSSSSITARHWYSVGFTVISGGPP